MHKLSMNRRHAKVADIEYQNRSFNCSILIKRARDLMTFYADPIPRHLCLAIDLRGEVQKKGWKDTVTWKRYWLDLGWQCLLFIHAWLGLLAPIHSTWEESIPQNEGWRKMPLPSSPSHLLPSLSPDSQEWTPGAPGLFTPPNGFSHGDEVQTARSLGQGWGTSY